MRKDRIRWPPGTTAWLFSTVLAALVHAFCGRVAAGHDLVAAVLVHRDVLVILAAAALVIARMFLFFLAPGWALHLVVKAWLLHRASRSAPDP